MAKGGMPRGGKSLRGVHWAQALLWGSLSQGALSSGRPLLRWLSSWEVLSGTSVFQNTGLKGAVLGGGILRWGTTLSRGLSLGETIVGRSSFLDENSSEKTFQEKLFSGLCDLGNKFSWEACIIERFPLCPFPTQWGSWQAPEVDTFLLCNRTVSETAPLHVHTAGVGKCLPSSS